MRTFKILVKKCIRDIVRNLKQFIAIIFIVAVAVTLFVGLQANSKEFERRVNIVYEQGNIADIWVTISPDLFSTTEMDEQYNELVEINGGNKENVEKRLYLPTSINNLSTNALISKNYPKINTAYELEITSDFNTNNFFVIDKDFISRYELMTGKEIALGDTLRITIDLATLGLSGDSFSGDVDEIYNNLVSYVESSQLLNDTFKELILTYLNNNKDNIVDGINSILEQVLSLETIELDAQVNGFMKHPENIQNATFNDSSYLLSSKLLLSELLNLVSKQINIENETISTFVKSFIASLKNSI